MSAKTASTALTSPIEAAAIELIEADTAVSIAPLTLEQVISFLGALGLPAIPVAPAQDIEKYHIVKNGKKVASFTGKNPSYLDRNGKPHKINHKQYQKRLPTEKELKTWFANPANGIGTLGGINSIYWPDFDVKNFATQAECNDAFSRVLEAHPALKQSWIERSHSGGDHLAVRLKQKPNFTNFALEPEGKQRGEIIGEGRFIVLAPTIGVSGNPYTCIQLAPPVEVKSIESVGFYSVAKARSIPAPQQRQSAPAIAGSIDLAQLGNDTATNILQGQDVQGDRSASLATAYREWCGWANWAAANGIAISGSAADLAHQAGEALGIDADRVDRILNGIDPAQCQPAAQYKGGDQACWKKIRRLDRASFEAVAPPAVRAAIEARFAKRSGNGQPPGNGGSGGGNGGNGGSGGSDDSFSENQWNAPISWQSEIGIWVEDKKTEELRFRPCCNFDFQVVRELTSEDGGGIEIALKRSFDRQEKSIFIESIAYTSPEKFVDAVKKALGAGVVCTLSKSDLSALIHTRLRDYHQRGGKTYRLAERRGRQPDGTWVFENCQFKADGTPTTTEESGWVYTEVFPNCEDVIPSPVIAPYDPTVLQRYLKVKQRAFGRNFLASVLMDGWVVAGIFDAEILAKERSFPLINPYGDPGGFKSFAAESSLSLVGFANAETMLSKVSESALFEWLKRLGSLPVILDDPKREANGIDIEEVVKRAYNRFARVVRGNRQEPHGGLGVTANHLVGEKNSATRSRLIPLFFPVLAEGSYDKAAFPELLQIRELVSGCFPDLLKLGYNALAIKQLEEVFHGHLPAAHARTAKSLAIATYYAAEVIRLAGLEAEINIQQWVIEVLCPLCNESQAGLSSVADFAEHLDVLYSRSLVGEWCIADVESEKHGSCKAVHLPTVWNAFDNEFQPAYNRSVLEQVLIERGAIKNQVAKFWADRDQTLAYKRQQVIAGHSDTLPKEPEKVARKCLLIPVAVWENLFAGHEPFAPSEAEALPPLSSPASYQAVTPVTSSYQAQVTRSNDSTASVSAYQNNVSYLVTSNQENQKKNDFDRVELSASAIEMADSKTESPQIEVTGVTSQAKSAETVAESGVEPVTPERLLEVTEAGQEVTELSNAHCQVQEELSTEQVSAALQAMSKIQSVVSFDSFASKYRLLPECQQQQIWNAASPELRQKYDHWRANFLAVPDIVWSAHHALMHTYSVPELKAVREQFEPEVLRSASNLLNKSVKAQIRGFLEAMESGL